MAAFWCRLGLFAVLSAGALGPASALTADEENDARVYAWDNAVFTMYHEIGHMFVDLYKLPVLAKEEDAVDNLATLMALDDYNRSDDPILSDAAAGWIASIKEEDYASMGASDFFDEHSINAQRAYAMICLLVGSDFDKFTEIATNFGLDKDRQEGCSGDFQQTKAAWDGVMKPHRKPNTGEPKITVEYAEPSEATKEGADILRANEVLETVARTVESVYTLPEDITFEGADCGEDNAYYSAGNASVTLCYELVQNYYDQYKTGVEAGSPPDALSKINPDGDGDAAAEDATGDDAAGEDAAGADEGSAAADEGSGEDDAGEDAAASGDAAAPN